MVGISGSGKSTFAKRWFKPTEIVSSDACRGFVSDDENNQKASTDAFELLHFWVGKRLQRGLLTVVDATNVQPDARRALINIAREHNCQVAAIVLNLPERVCGDRNLTRGDRNFGAHVLRQQRSMLRNSFATFRKEGIRFVHELRTEEEVDAVTAIVRTPLNNDLRHEHGPFDIIGDVHGCFSELNTLLEKLGYIVARVPETESNFGFQVTPPAGRKAVFVGDLVDRGPDSPGVLRVVMSMVNAGIALCVPGNHDDKLKRKLDGANVQLKHGLEKTMEQLSTASEAFLGQVKNFIEALPSHYVLHDGKLVVAHAGLKAEMQGRSSGRVRSFALFGETTGETDEFGLPVRLNWALDYRGEAAVVYGHTPVPDAQWLNNTIDIDTGCVFGGKLTALRYPERELVSVVAEQVWCEPKRPLELPSHMQTAQQENDNLLDIADVTGKRFIQTRLRHNITVREENAIAALEAMSRFAVNPKWLIYLPPTMSPSETSEAEDFLEHPFEAFSYFGSRGVEKVVCQEKHMGSRAVIVICRDEEAALKRFGIGSEGIGVCITRTGRRFFTPAQKELETEFMQRVHRALTLAGAWEKYNTSWFCLDCELMPWSAKAQGLLQKQYAAVGASSLAGFPAAADLLRQTQLRNIAGVDALLQNTEARHHTAERFVDAYRQYCWSVSSINDYRLAPFHLLATEGAVHTGKDHVWHMNALHEICAVDPQFMQATQYKVIELGNRQSVDEAVNWWIELTGKGGEGMVVKPFQFVTHYKYEPIQPAVKCRGREYLRIIYGPEYTLPENMQRLRKRNVSGKRSLAMREFALGVEALERFVRNEPLRRVHECVFGVLALESEEIDPRL